MSSDLRSAFTRETDPRRAADALCAQWGDVAPRVLVFFAPHTLDGAVLSAHLRARFPAAEVVGCTTAGAFTAAEHDREGTSALALGPGLVRRAAAALVDLHHGEVDRAVRAAADQLSLRLERPLRELEPERYVGVALLEGLRGHEEAVNAELGNVAPLLPFVGGSAGDDGHFARTRVYRNGDESADGAVLLVLEVARPFRILKSHHFEPTGQRLTVTRASARVIHELDGRPALVAYAEALGLAPQQVGPDAFSTHPLGLEVRGEHWTRSPQQVLPGGAMRFYCEVLEGTELHVLRARDLVADTRASLEAAVRALGAAPAGGLYFNCILRRVELDRRGLHGEHLALLAGQQAAGFHTYGESYLGHINQTLTALLFG